MRSADGLHRQIEEISSKISYFTEETNFHTVEMPIASIDSRENDIFFLQKLIFFKLAKKGWKRFIFCACAYRNYVTSIRFMVNGNKRANHGKSQEWNPLNSSTMAPHR